LFFYSSFLIIVKKRIKIVMKLSEHIFDLIWFFFFSDQLKKEHICNRKKNYQNSNNKHHWKLKEIKINKML